MPPSAELEASAKMASRHDVSFVARMIQSRSIDMRLSTNRRPSARSSRVSVAPEKPVCSSGRSRASSRRWRRSNASSPGGIATGLPAANGVDIMHDRAGAVAREKHDEHLILAGVRLHVHLKGGHVDEVAFMRVDGFA